MLCLHGMGHYHPETCIDNNFLADLDIGSDANWILERVGISSRRTTLPLDYIRTTYNEDPRAASEAAETSRYHMAEAAARMAMERAGVTAGDIGLVVFGSCSGAMGLPAEAACVAQRLGITAPVMDLNSACSTFVVQLCMLNAMDPESLPRFVLVVNTETMTHCVDYRDRNVAPLFGDGSSAAVVSGRELSPYRFSALSWGSDPGSWEMVVHPRHKHFSQDGPSVQRFAIRRGTDELKKLQEQSTAEAGQFRFIGHQANYLMLDHIRSRCRISEDRHWHNVSQFGNTGCAGAPCVLSQQWDSLQPGDHVALVVVGAGLTWASGLITAGGSEGEKHAVL